LGSVRLSKAVFLEALYDKDTKWPRGFDYRNSGAIGPEANLFGPKKVGDIWVLADWSKESLIWAKQCGANVTDEQISKAKSRDESRMLDGSRPE